MYNTQRSFDFVLIFYLHDKDKAPILKATEVYTTFAKLKRSGIK